MRIRTSFRALEWQIEQFEKDATTAESEENLIQQVENILKRIYAYISWGIRYQAKTESDVDQILMELGFRVPPTGGQRLFDIVAPVILFIAVITAVFWGVFNAVMGMMGPNSAQVSEIIISALVSGIAAAFMYGGAIFIGLKQRSNQIDQGLWREGSPTCLFPIAFKAGLLVWCVIAAMTVVGQFPAALGSLAAIAHAIKSVAGTEPGGSVQGWSMLPKLVLSAAPWFVTGATVSVMVAVTVGRHITRGTIEDRTHDMISQGTALGLAAALAQLVQGSLNELLLKDLFGPFSPFPVVPMVGLVGAACGAAIGFLVPATCRANLTKPSDRIMARALQELRIQAEKTVGKTAAEAWIFEARPELGGITPAEAVQHKGRATSAARLLDIPSNDFGDENRRPGMDRPVRVVIEGGRLGP